MSIVLLAQGADSAAHDLTVLRELGAEFVEESAHDDWAVRSVRALA